MNTGMDELMVLQVNTHMRKRFFIYLKENQITLPQLRALNGFALLVKLSYRTRNGTVINALQK